ncbi:MAG TPA: YbaB/EbfC family nucleoid-associated protein [Gemmataceae bacterium]|nr:YbaB/EbfC family nucleoid-associated protein [Gemmataceae bacterium]
MFKELGQMSKLLTQLPKIQEEMTRLQQRLGELTAEGDAGAGMVKVKVNGRMEVLAVQLGDDALAMKDKEMLEEMVKAATNQAIERVRQQAAQETSKMASSLGVPPGMGMPGLP